MKHHFAPWRQKPRAEQALSYTYENGQFLIEDGKCASLGTKRYSLRTRCSTPLPHDAATGTIAESLGLASLRTSLSAEFVKC